MNKDSSVVFTANDLFAKIGQLTIENDFMRSEIERFRQLTSENDSMRAEIERLRALVRTLAVQEPTVVSDAQLDVTEP